MINFKNEFYLKIILIISSIALIAAYSIEYILGHQPCNLCLIERIPYGLNIILIISIFILKKNEKFLVSLLIITSIFSFTISLYHFGIEQELIQESAACGVKNLTEGITKEEVLKQLNKRVISCKDVTFRIFGFSLTSVNIILSLIFIICFTNIYTKYEKKKQ